MKIDVFFTPFFPEKETQFDDSIVVMIDVLRASTTICATLFNGAREIIPSESLEKAVQVYNNLSRETRFLGGERNGVKPNGFDAGNSPEEYSSEAVKGKTVILTTTNGTKLFQKAKRAKKRIVGAFVNLISVSEYLKKIINENRNDNVTIDIMCAGNDGRLSYEDTLCAGAFINKIIDFFPDSEMTDSSHVAKNLFLLHSKDYHEFLKLSEHALTLKKLGYESDIETALSYNIYPVVPVISGNSIKHEIN